MSIVWSFQTSQMARACTVLDGVTVGCLEARFIRLLGSRQIFSFFRPFGAATRRRRPEKSSYSTPYSHASTLTAFFLSTKSFRGPESRQCALWGVGIVSLLSNSATRNTVKLFPRGESKRFFYRRRSLCTTRPQWYHTDGTRVERFICSPWE